MESVKVGDKVTPIDNAPYPYCLVRGQAVSVTSVAPDGAFFGRADDGTICWRWQPEYVTTPLLTQNRDRAVVTGNTDQKYQQK